MLRPAASHPPVAVILAAGLGSRLQAVHSAKPKGFVEVEGLPIIARSVAALQRAGIREFVFVVGWQKQAYELWCAVECPGAVCVENADYTTTGSLRSLLLGSAAVPGRDILLVESDLLYEQRAPDLLLASPSADTVLISDFTRSRDEVWVYAAPGEPSRLAHLTKQRAGGSEPVGELVGLSRVSAALLAQLRRAAESLSPAAHYEDGFNAVAERHSISLLRVPGLAWCEIDDAAHLERARGSIWPRILAADLQDNPRSAS